jgi:endoglucanase
MREEIALRGFSWAYWELAAGFGVYDPVTKAFRKPLLEALFLGKPVNDVKQY